MPVYSLVVKMNKKFKIGYCFTFRNKFIKIYYKDNGLNTVLEYYANIYNKILVDCKFKSMEELLLKDDKFFVEKCNE